MDHVFRSAVAADCSDLALLGDIATRRFLSWIWGEGANPGQPGLELARSAIRTDSTSVNHYTNWDVAEHEGNVIAGLNSFVLPLPADSAGMAPHVAEVVAPLDELKTIAQGTWYISVASVFPEGRGQGIGTGLLARGADHASEAGVDQVTLLVGSFNEGARRLYERNGFEEWDRRRFIPFPGSDADGHWILMVKSAV